jgi:peptidoglycan/LPS O-acetylase OafA/YrhL
MNWFRAYRIRPDSGLLGHTWSLSIEEQFYLVWPALFALLMRSRLGKGGILACVLAGLAASAGMRAAHWLRYHDWFRLYYGLDSRADSLLAGCLLGFLAGWNLLPRSPVWRIGGALGAAYVLWIAIVPLEEGIHLTVGHPILNLAASLIVVSLMLPGPSALRRILEFPALVWVGKISYGLYLWHLLVYQALLKLRWVDFAWSYALACVLSIAAAAVSYYGLEIHFLKRKRRPATPTPDPGT